MNFQKENFDFYSHTLRGVTVMEPRWKRCVRLVDRNLGEALGQVFVAKTFGPDVKARTVKMTREIEAAMEDDLKDLPWMSPANQTAGARQAALHRQQDRLSRQVARLQLARDRARRFRRQRAPQRHLRIEAGTGEDRQTRRSRRVGNDSTHGERLLRCADERHQFPRRRSATAFVRPQDG